MAPATALVLPLLLSAGVAVLAAPNNYATALLGRYIVNPNPSGPHPNVYVLPPGSQNPFAFPNGPFAFPTGSTSAATQVTTSTLTSLTPATQPPTTSPRNMTSAINCQLCICCDTSGSQGSFIRPCCGPNSNCTCINVGTLFGGTQVGVGHSNNPIYINNSGPSAATPTLPNPLHPVPPGNPHYVLPGGNPGGGGDSINYTNPPVTNPSSGCGYQTRPPKGPCAPCRCNSPCRPRCRPPTTTTTTSTSTTTTTTTAPVACPPSPSCPNQPPCPPQTICPSQNPCPSCECNCEEPCEQPCSPQPQPYTAPPTQRSSYPTLTYPSTTPPTNYPITTYPQTTATQSTIPQTTTTLRPPPPPSAQECCIVEIIGGQAQVHCQCLVGPSGTCADTHSNLCAVHGSSISLSSYPTGYQGSISCEDAIYQGIISHQDAQCTRWPIVPPFIDTTYSTVVPPSVVEYPTSAKPGNAVAAVSALTAVVALGVVLVFTI